MQNYKLGMINSPYTSKAINLKELKTYYKDALNLLPQRPSAFGYENLIQTWGMLANDRLGCCVQSGIAHQIMLWTAMGGKSIARFTDKEIERHYSDVTGYQPNNPSSDNGTMPATEYKYLKNYGITDADGIVHKIEKHIALEPRDMEDLLNATYLFGSACIGIQVPENAIDQFKQGKPWSVVAGTTTEGGHYICGVAYRSSVYVVTWGRVQKMTPKFYEKYCSESACILTPEMFNGNGYTPEGFHIDELRRDLSLL